MLSFADRITYGGKSPRQYQHHLLSRTAGFPLDHHFLCNHHRHQAAGTLRCVWLLNSSLQLFVYVIFLHQQHVRAHTSQDILAPVADLTDLQGLPPAAASLPPLPREQCHDLSVALQANRPCVTGFPHGFHELHNPGHGANRSFSSL